MSQIIINHLHRDYQRLIENNPAARYNGAYYYSLEICRRIIPAVKTSRPWVTINVPGQAVDRAIVFIHNNLNPEVYSFLNYYRDLVLVCCLPETRAKVEHLGKAIYLPLSIDVEQVAGFRVPEHQRTKDTAFAGRRKKRIEADLPEGIDILEGMPRELLLSQMARYRRVYAVGRTALEAKALGCEVLPYDPRFPDPSRWQVIDNSEAALMLQLELDRIDGNHTPKKRRGSSGNKNKRGGSSLAAKEGGVPKENKNKEGASLKGGTQKGGSPRREDPRKEGTKEVMAKAKKETKKEAEKWEQGFPEKNGIYKCRIDGETVEPLMHKVCTINGKHRWMKLDGHDAIGNIEFINKRIGFDEI